MNHCNGCSALQTELDRANGHLQQCHSDIKALERQIAAKDGEIRSLQILIERAQPRCSKGCDVCGGGQ